jgi:hypothetical protein
MRRPSTRRITPAVCLQARSEAFKEAGKVRGRSAQGINRIPIRSHIKIPSQAAMKLAPDR